MKNDQDLVFDKGRTIVEKSYIGMDILCMGVGPMWWCLSTSVSLTTCLLRPSPSQSTLSLKYSHCHSWMDSRTFLLVLPENFMIFQVGGSSRRAKNTAIFKEQ